jgi:hypothetical protein
MDSVTDAKNDWQEQFRIHWIWWIQEVFVPQDLLSSLLDDNNDDDFILKLFYNKLSLQIIKSIKISKHI